MNMCNIINGFSSGEIFKLYNYLETFEKYKRRKIGDRKDEFTRLNAIYDYIYIEYGNYEKISKYQNKPILTQIVSTKTSTYYFLKNLRDSIAHAYISQNKGMVEVKNYKNEISNNLTIYGMIPSNEFFNMLNIINQNL